MAERTCVLCGASITMGRSDRKYCSALCSSRSFNDRRRSDGRLKAQRKKHAGTRNAWMREAKRAGKYRYTEERQCAYCGHSFDAPRGTPQSTCSRICASAAKRGEWPTSRVPWRTCPDCGDVRIERGPSPSRCEDCRRPARPRVFVGGECAWCGDAFVVPSFTGEARYCSARCLKKWHKSQRESSPFLVSPVVRAAIYERDRWLCQICYEPVDANAHYLDDWAPSLDHIVPQSKGGGHEPENLRLAHRWCNAVRGDGSYYADELFAAA